MPNDAGIGYHTAPALARASILRFGLLPFTPGDGRTPQFASQPAGVYLTADSGEGGHEGRWSEMYFVDGDEAPYREPWDVWRVDVRGLPFQPDPMVPECRVYGHIPPTRLALYASYPGTSPSTPTERTSRGLDPLCRPAAQECSTHDQGCCRSCPNAGCRYCGCRRDAERCNHTGGPIEEVANG